MAVVYPGEASFMAELFGTADLIGRLTGMRGDLESKAEEAEAKAERAMAALRGALFGVLAARGLTCSDELRAEIAGLL